MTAPVDRLPNIKNAKDVWLDRYNNQRTHQGKRCQGRTPMQTFTENMLAAKEKMWDMEGSSELTATI
ncbi:MAG: hypothetical protein F3741_05530 [Nitrospinae bacterium]|nr:hypothetical protein [Nitrospinota bacterium]